MIRIFDFVLSFLAILILFPIFILLIIIGFFESGSPIFLQYRVGYNQKLFLLIKFRTMKKDTKSAATHLINSSMITSYGNLLRRIKLDEFPQLFNVLIGDMSFVGPRPCLLIQKKLINERKKEEYIKLSLVLQDLLKFQV